MSFSIIAFIKVLILPPAINFIFIILGLLLLKQRKYVSRFLLYVGSLSLVVFCLPPFSTWLLESLEEYPALELPIVVNNEQAIVVLSGGIRPKATEYARDIDNTATLERNHYAAFLHKQTDLPVLVTGGRIKPEFSSHATVMTETLKDSFNIEVTWQEDKARNTAENAIYSAAILQKNNIDTVFLVTHAWHMPRAVMVFEQQGLRVTPAPTIFTMAAADLPAWSYYIPSVLALRDTRVALHEYIGMLWYKLRYGT